jgi:hypothetical protein
VQLNIFLAISVNGYSAMQSGGMSEPDGILTEVSEIIVHEVKRVLKVLRKGYRYVSNEELAFRPVHSLLSDVIDLFLDPVLGNLVR